MDEGRNRQGSRLGWRVVGRSTQVAEGGERGGGEGLSLNQEMGGRIRSKVGEWGKRARR